MAVSTVLGFFGEHWWFFDLFSHFRAQYAISSLLLAVAALGIRSRSYFLLAFSPFVVNAPVLAPMYLASPAPPHPDAKPLKVVHFNVNSANPRRAEALAYARSTNADVIVLLEIGGGWRPLLEHLEPPYKLVEVGYSADNFGIAMLSRVPITASRVVTHGGFYVAAIEADLVHDGQPVTIIGAHVVPPMGSSWADERALELQSIVRRIRERDAGSEVVLVGDFNLTPWSFAHARLLDEGRLVSALDGRGYQYTWPSWPPLLQIPIDLSFHSTGLTSVAREIGPAEGSDHYAVTVSLARTKTSSRSE